MHSLAQALPIFLDRLADPVTAVIVSIIVVLVFGEPGAIADCSLTLLAAYMGQLFLAVFLGTATTRSIPVQAKSFHRHSALLMGWPSVHMQHGLSSC